MDKSKFKVYATAKETLDSCGMTREEFLNDLKVGWGCSGFSNNGEYSSIKLKCSDIDCYNCPISHKNSKEQIISWLNETVPKSKKVSKSDLEKLYVLREKELANSIDLYEGKCTKFKTLKSYNDINSATDEEIQKDIDYLEKVLEINKEVSKFPNWTVGEYCVVDFYKKQYMNSKLFDGQEFKEAQIHDGVVLLVDHFKEELEKRKLVEVPENLKHLIPKLKSKEITIQIDLSDFHKTLKKLGMA